MIVTKRNFRFLQKIISVFISIALLCSQVGWAAQVTVSNNPTNSHYLANESEFLKRTSGFSSKAFLTMAVLLEIIKSYPFEVDISLLNNWVHETKFNHVDLYNVLAIPFTRETSGSSRQVTFLGKGFKIAFFPADETHRGFTIPNSFLRVEIKEAGSTEKDNQAAVRVSKKSAYAKLTEPLKRKVKERLKKHPRVNRLVEQAKTYRQRHDSAKEKQWILDQLEKYKHPITVTERKEILDEFNKRNIWERFHQIIRYGEDIELVYQIIDNLVIIINDTNLGEEYSFVKTRILTVLIKFLDDDRPIVLKNVVNFLISMYEFNAYKEEANLTIGDCKLISKAFEEFFKKRIPQLLQNNYADENKFLEERLDLYKILGDVYYGVHSLSVEKLNELFRDDDVLIGKDSNDLVEKLALLSQEITNDSVRDRVTKTIITFSRRRIRELLIYLQDEKDKKDVIRAFSDDVDIREVFSTFRRLWERAVTEKSEKVKPRMLKSVVRRIVSIYGAIEDLEQRSLMQDRIDSLFNASSVVVENGILPFVNVAFDVASYKEYALKQMIQLFSDVSTREELLTMLNQLIMVSHSRPYNTSIKRTIFAVLIAKLGPGHFGRKLYYLTHNQTNDFKISLYKILLHAAVSFSTISSVRSIKDEFKIIKEQVNGGLNLARIDFFALEELYIPDSAKPLNDADNVEKLKWLNYLLTKTPEGKALISRHKIDRRIFGINKTIKIKDEAELGKLPDNVKFEKWVEWSRPILGLLRASVAKMKRGTVITDIVFQEEREELIKFYSSENYSEGWDAIEGEEKWLDAQRRKLLEVLKDDKINKSPEVQLELTSSILNDLANTLILANGIRYDFRELIKHLVQSDGELDLRDFLKLLYVNIRLAKFAFKAGHSITDIEYVDRSFYIKNIHKTFRDKELDDIRKELDREAEGIITAFRDEQGTIISGIPISLHRNKLIIGEKDFLKLSLSIDLEVSALNELTTKEKEFVSAVATAIFDPSQAVLSTLNKLREGLVIENSKRAETFFQEILKNLQDDSIFTEYAGYKYTKFILKQNYDIVIVGFGPAGAASAITARKKMPDAKILVVEFQPREYRKACAGILEERAIWGIKQLLGDSRFQEFKRQHLVATNHLRTFSPAGRGTLLNSLHYVIDRGILNVWLRERAEELDIDFLDEHNVKKISKFIDKDTDHFRSVTIASTANKSVLDIKGKFVLLGTGYKSEKLFKNVGLERDKTHQGMAKVVYVPVDENFIKEYFTKDGDLNDLIMEVHWFTDEDLQKPPTKYGWILPKREGNRWYLDIGIGGFEKGTVNLEQLHKFIERLKRRFNIGDYKRIIERAGLEFGGGGIIRFKPLDKFDKEGLVVVGSSGGIEHPFAEDGIGVSILSGIRAAEKLHDALERGEDMVDGYTEEMHRIVYDQDKLGFLIQQVFLKNPKLVNVIFEHANRNILTQAVFTELFNSKFDPDIYSEHFQWMMAQFAAHALHYPGVALAFIKAFFRNTRIMLKLVWLMDVGMIIKEYYRQFIKNPRRVPDDEPIDLIQVALILNTLKRNVIVNVSQPVLRDEVGSYDIQEAFDLITNHLREGDSVFFRNREFYIEPRKEVGFLGSSGSSDEDERHNFQAKIDNAKVDVTGQPLVDGMVDIVELEDVVTVTDTGELVFKSQFSQLCDLLDLDEEKVERVLKLAVALKEEGDDIRPISKLQFKLSARYDYLFGDHKRNNIVTLNDRALRKLPESSRLLALAIGFLHEVLGHEQNMHNDGKLTEQDVKLTKILILLLRLSLNEYMNDLGKILIENESPYLKALGENLSLTKQEAPRKRVMPERRGDGKTILITGATSQEGSHIAYYFAKKGYRVIATDMPERARYRFDHPNIEFKPLDVTDIDKFVELLNIEYVDLIVNASGVIDGRLEEQNKINAYAAYSIALEAVERKIPFFHISSATVYGLRELKDATEDTELLPDSNDSKSKALGERLILSLTHKAKTPVAILRLPGVYGRSREIHGYNRVLWAVKNRLLPLYPTSPPIVGVKHSYVDSMITIPSAIEFLFDYEHKDKVYGHVFHVANPKPLLFIDVLDRIKEEMSRRMPFRIFVPYNVARILMFVAEKTIRLFNLLLPKDWKIILDYEINHIRNLYHDFTLNTDKLDSLGFNPDAPTFLDVLPQLVEQSHIKEGVIEPIEVNERDDFQAKIDTVKMDATGNLLVDSSAETVELEDVLTISNTGELVFESQFSQLSKHLDLDVEEAKKVLRLAFALREKDDVKPISNLQFKLSARYDHLFGDHKKNNIVTLNDRALRQLPESSRLLALAIGFSHEILGHEQDNHDEGALTEQDVNLTQILILLLRLSPDIYMNHLEAILIKGESPYLDVFTKNISQTKDIPFSIINKISRNKLLPAANHIGLTQALIGLSEGSDLFNLIHRFSSRNTLLKGFLTEKTPDALQFVKGLVLYYVMFAERIMKDSGTREEPHMDMEEAILEKLKTNLGLTLTDPEDEYLKSIIKPLWNNRDALNVLAGNRKGQLGSKIDHLQNELQLPDRDISNVRREVETSIKDGIGAIRTKIELGDYTSEQPGILIFDLDKLISDAAETSEEYLGLLEDIVRQDGDYALVLVNHNPSDPISRRLSEYKGSQKELGERLETLAGKVITVDTTRMKEYEGTDIGRAIITKAKEKAAQKIGVTEVPEKNITLALDPANLYLYPKDILNGLTLLILSSTTLTLTEEQLAVLKEIYPALESHLQDGRELILLEEVYYNMKLLQEIREARDKIRNQA